MTPVRFTTSVTMLASIVVLQASPFAVAEDPPQVFQTLDINKDGVLTGTEMDGLESFDSNGDKVVSLEEYNAAQPSPPPEQIKAKFTERDGNNDGWLSGTEIKGIESYDSDGNSRVTWEEFNTGVSGGEPDPSDKSVSDNNPLTREASLYKVISNASSRITSYQGPDKSVTEENLAFGEVVRVTKVDDSLLWVERTLPEAQLAVGWIPKGDVVDVVLGEPLLRDAIEQTKESRYYEALAVLFQAEDRLDEAIELLTTAIDAAPQNPESARLYVLRSEIWQDKHYPSKAFADISDAMNLQRNTEAQMTRAVFWAYRNDEGKAIRDLNDVIAAEPNNPLAYAYRASVLSMFGHDQVAYDDYTKAIELRPFHAGFYNSRSSHIVRKGDRASEEEVDAALADISIALELDPTNADSWLKRGLLWARKHDTSKTLADVGEAFKRARAGSEARQINFELAQACFAGEQKEKGVGLLKEAADEDQCPQAYFGLVFEQLGSDPKAALEYAKAAVRGYHDEFGHEMLAVAFAANGDLESARAAMNLAIFLATSESERDRLRESMQSMEPKAFVPAAPVPPSAVAESPVEAANPGTQRIQLVPLAPQAPRP